MKRGEGCLDSARIQSWMSTHRWREIVAGWREKGKGGGKGEDCGAGEEGIHVQG